MSNLSTICRPHAVLASLMCRSFTHQARSRVKVSFRNLENLKPSFSSPSPSSPWLNGNETWFRFNQRRTAIKAASNWNDEKSPYETLGNACICSFHYVLNLLLFCLTKMDIMRQLLEMQYKYRKHNYDGQKLSTKLCRIWILQ